MAENYRPSQEILDKYANVLINFALNDCKGIKKGEVIFLQVPECAKPLLVSLRKAVLKAGAHPIIEYLPDEIAREFYELAEEHHLNFFPDKYFKGKVDQMDHLIFIIAEIDKHELVGIDPKKIMSRSKAFKPYFDWRNEKENAGKMTWTLALYATEAMAKEAGLSLEEYWEQIIKACYLDEKDPIAKWKEMTAEVERVKNKLDELRIQKLRIKSEGTDLIVGLGKNRKWMGGSGRNIPSFEVFISPDCRLSEGYITIGQPLYRYGNLIEGVCLEFKNGEVISAKASKGEDILKGIIATDEGAKKVGEFSLTDSRLSRITKFMAETLFDENVGGKYGNTHIALGKAYQDSYPGKMDNVSKNQWDKMGYNDSSVHTDIVATSNREVIAFLSDGKEKVIYRDGKFLI